MIKEMDILIQKRRIVEVNLWKSVTISFNCKVDARRLKKMLVSKLDHVVESAGFGPSLGIRNHQVI